MGTQYNISIINPSNRSEDASDLKVKIDDLLQKINQQMSTYISDSEISKFNRYKKKSWFPVSKDFAFVVSTAQDISIYTNGAFDITVSPLIDLWGFGAKTQFTTPAPSQVSSALKNTGYEYLKVRSSPPAIKKSNENIRIDLSAIAKGFAVDMITNFLTKNKYSDFLVEIGGEINARGLNQLGLPWRIGIETADRNTNSTNKTLNMSNIGIATSGDYRNFFIKDGIRYSHTINPKNGYPVTHNLASVTVLNESTMVADAYATALMVMGEIDGKTFVDQNNLKVNLSIRESINNNLINWMTFNKIAPSKNDAHCKFNQPCAYLE